VTVIIEFDEVTDDTNIELGDGDVVIVTGGKGEKGDPGAADELAILEAAVTAETTRATTAEAALADDLTAETTRATTAEADLADDLTAEVTRATTAEAGALPATLFTATNQMLRSTGAGAAQGFTIANDCLVGRIGGSPTITSYGPTNIKSLLNYQASEIDVVSVTGITSGDVAAALAELAANVSAEAAARVAAISTAVNDLINSAPGTLDTLGEIATALADTDDAVAALTTAINARALQSALDAEAAARTAADTALDTRLDTAEGDIDAAEASILAETTRATTAEGELYQGEINRAAEERSVRVAAEAALQTDIDAEVTRATGAEGGLDTRLGTVEARALPSPPPDIQTFGATLDLTDPSLSTWTKPAHLDGYQPYRFVDVYLVGGGGGGGSGRRGAAGTLRTGAGSGAGGSITIRTLNYDDLPATVELTVTAGGLGAVPTTVDDSNGTPGGMPRAAYEGTTVATALRSRFGPYVGATANPPAATGGHTGSAAGGGVGSGTILGGAGLASTATGGTAGAGAFNVGPSSGGAGGGITAADVAYPGGRASHSSSRGDVSGPTGLSTYAIGGVVPGGNGQDGDTLTPRLATLPGLGGGGGAAHASGAGGRGGHGGWPGGGGGGGGASVNGYPSGAGGDGADGVCIVTTR